MKISYLPFHEPESPEFMHFEYFRRVAGSYGCAAHLCLNAEQVRQVDPDFVLVFGYFNPKLTEHPHYGLMQCPRDYPASWAPGLRNVYTWDGFLTTAKATEQWLEEVIRHRDGDKGPRVGHFFVTGDVQTYEEDYRPQQLIYAGTGWDGRGLDLCRLLQHSLGDTFCVYGDPKHWTKLALPAYRGFVPTTKALLDRYRRGVVLSLSGAPYLRDDVMTTRMHEASSVGAVTITARTSETMLMYGNSLCYFDAQAGIEIQAQQILSHFLAVRDTTGRFESMRRAAYDAFTREHSLPAQFPRLLRYHAYITSHLQQRKRTSHAASDPSSTV